MKSLQQKLARILIGDDHALVAAGLTKLLEEDYDVVGIATDGRELLESARKCHPDVILLDISMPLLSGIEAARRLSVELPASKLIFVTMHRDVAYLKESIRAGASGYVLKGSAGSELATALEAVLNGKIFISPALGEDLPADFLCRGASGRERPILSQRQREVLQLIAEGHSAKRMAHILKISRKTVEFHRAQIKKNLKIQSTAELTQYWLQHQTAEIETLPNSLKQA